MYAPRYEEAFLPMGKKRLRSLRSFGLASLTKRPLLPHDEEAFLPMRKKRPRSLRSLGLASLRRGFFALRGKDCPLGRFASSASGLITNRRNTNTAIRYFSYDTCILVVTPLGRHLLAPLSLCKPSLTQTFTESLKIEI